MKHNNNKFYNKQLYHPRFNQLCKNTEENKFKEHIVVSCELSGFTLSVTQKIIKKYLKFLVPYKNMKPYYLSEILPSLIKRIEHDLNI